MKVGIGFDFHPFKSGNTIILGGVEIASTYALEGHSDADVIIHSIVDAILGAAGIGDIGDYFPPSDDRWKDVSSVIFLIEALKMIQEKGYRVVNVDITYIGEIPRLAEKKKDISANLTNIINAPVNLKATTMEGFGIIGRKEGAAAIAVALLEEVSNG